MVIKFFLDSWLRFIFPPLCLHCNHSVERGLLCTTCIKSLTLLTPISRCCSCLRLYCRCSRGKFVAAFASAGPAATLLQCEAHTRTAAAFIVVQFAKMGWPMPDLITAVPAPFANLQSTLAQEVATLLNRPYRSTLKCLKVGLHREQFFLKSSSKGERVLLIDGFLQKDALKRCSELLQQNFSEIYAIAVCS